MRGRQKRALLITPNQTAELTILTVFRDQRMKNRVNGASVGGLDEI